MVRQAHHERLNLMALGLHTVQYRTNFNCCRGCHPTREPNDFSGYRQAHNDRSLQLQQKKLTTQYTGRLLKNHLVDSQQISQSQIKQGDLKHDGQHIPVWFVFDT
jgi:hypothetical protein